MKKLKLSVNTKAATLNPNKLDDLYAQNYKRCYHCHFPISLEGLRVFEDKINTSKNPKKPKYKSEYYPLCDICFATQNLELHEGTFIVMPEISQAELINLYRIIRFTERAGSEEDRDSVESLKESILERGAALDALFGRGASSKDVIRLTLYSLYKEDIEAYNDRDEVLSDVRWFPSDSLVSEDYKYNKNGYREFQKKFNNKIFSELRVKISNDRARVAAEKNMIKRGLND